MGCHFLHPGDLPDPGTKPRSPALQADTLLSEPPPAATAKLLQSCPTLCDPIDGSSSSTALLVAQMVKSPPAMQETWVWSLGQEDPMEKEMTTHSSILDMGLQRVIRD